MSADSLTRLAAADPVPHAPTVEPVERLAGLIEDNGRAVEGDGYSHAQPKNAGSRTRTRFDRRALAGILIAAAASAIGLAMSDGPSGSSLNVAAAAYAATSPGTGIVEAVFVERFYQRHRIRVTTHDREWVDAVAGRRREQRTLDGGRVEELASAPGQVEQWNNLDPRETDLVRRFLTTSQSRGPFHTGLHTEATGITLYRLLYQHGKMTLIGRERHDGRLLWRLETPPIAVAYPRGGSRPVPVVGLVVLVDPNTFLPISQQVINLQLPGHPVEQESNLVSYRRLAGNEPDLAVLDLAAQHPSARVVTSSRRGWTLSALLHEYRSITRRR